MMLRERWIAAFIGLAVALGSPAACSGDGKPDIVTPSGGSGGGGGSGGSGGGADADVSDSAVDGGSDGSAADAAITPVRLGVIPTPRVADGGAAPIDQQLAELEVLSAGSRGVSLVRRWDALYSGPSAAVVTQWSGLEQTAALFHGAGRSLVVCLALIDRTDDARPSGLSAWNDTATQKALELMIDKTFATFGSELFALSFGNELDRWLAKASAADRADVVALIEHGISYARSHSAKPPAAAIGVTFTSDAVVSGSQPEVAALISASDVVVATLVALDAAFEARAPTTVAKDLDLLSAAAFAGGADAGDAGGSDAADAAAPKIVVLQEVAYPSSAAAGSSDEQQRTFYDSLFQALSTRRERFPFVAVRELHDAEISRCEEEAQRLGAVGNPVALAAHCSFGLKTVDGSPKPSWASVVDALATFAAP